MHEGGCARSICYRCLRFIPFLRNSNTICKALTRLAKPWSFHLTEMAESQNIEWKQSWQDNYLKWVCGFANAHGGTIYIGKDPARFLPGMSVRIGSFGTSDSDLRFQEVVEGNLIRCLRDTVDQLLGKFLIKPITFEGIQRVENRLILSMPFEKCFSMPWSIAGISRVYTCRFGSIRIALFVGMMVPYLKKFPWMSFWESMPHTLEILLLPMPVSRPVT